MAYDRRTGELVWQSELHRDGLMPKHEKNSHASATPACDGQRVYVPMMNGGHLWLSAVDLDGQLAWQTKIGEYKNGNGYGSSPVLFDSLVIVSNDNEAEASLVGVEGKRGDIVWRAQRQSSSNSASPIVGLVAGRPQLLMNGAGSVSSYDPATGERLWFVNHHTDVAACTMAFDELRVYASGNVPEKEWLCVRADGEGDVAESHVEWRTDQRVTYVPSPLVHEGCLFFVTDGGLAFCLDAASGKEIWKHRLGGSFIASPVLAGDNIFATADNGATFVFEAQRKFNQRARNELGEACFATPALSGDRIFLRTANHLYCIGHEGQDQRKPVLEAARPRQGADR
ncbi:MAG TPA: PQQ-binding-like beta-propeller repeat protein [Pirellulales bacterium]|nr:PQQ-binding-like beta-propeller repeat protein [Pirellulales bacterium]